MRERCAREAEAEGAGCVGTKVGTGSPGREMGTGGRCVGSYGPQVQVSSRRPPRRYSVPEAMMRRCSLRSPDQSASSGGEQSPEPQPRPQPRPQPTASRKRKQQDVDLDANHNETITTQTTAGYVDITLANISPWAGWCERF